MGNDHTKYNKGSTPTEMGDHTNIFPETNFERYAAEHIRILHDKYDNLARESHANQQLEVESSSEEDSIESF